MKDGNIYICKKTNQGQVIEDTVLYCTVLILCTYLRHESIIGVFTLSIFTFTFIYAFTHSTSVFTWALCLLLGIQTATMKSLLIFLETAKFGPSEGDSCIYVPFPNFISVYSTETTVFRLGESLVMDLVGGIKLETFFSKRGTVNGVRFVFFSWFFLTQSKLCGNISTLDSPVIRTGRVLNN